MLRTAVSIQMLLNLYQFKRYLNYFMMVIIKINSKKFSKNSSINFCRPLYSKNIPNVTYG